VDIDDFIYAQCVTYIGSEEKTLDHDVWTGGGAFEGGGGGPGGTREGAAHHPM
jgi:hypothetical protein